MYCGSLGCLLLQRNFGKDKEDLLFVMIHGNISLRIIRTCKVLFFHSISSINKHFHFCLSPKFGC